MEGGRVDDRFGSLDHLSRWCVDVDDAPCFVEKLLCGENEDAKKVEDLRPFRTI